MQEDRKPSCYAAACILANRNSNGKLLRELQSISDAERTYGDLLAMHIMQRESAWKEEELYAGK